MWIFFWGGGLQNDMLHCTSEYTYRCYVEMVLAGVCDVTSVFC